MKNLGPDTPHHLTGGVSNTLTKNRGIPSYRRGVVPEGYGRVVARGWDTIEETMDFHFRPDFIKRLEDARTKAAESDDRGRDLAEIDIGGEPFFVASHGGQGGVRFFAMNDDLLIRFRSEKTEWNVSVRYLAAGLWRHGAPVLRAIAYEILCAEGKPRSAAPVRVKRADFAVDIYCPGFKSEMGRWAILDQIIAPVACKRRPVGNGSGLETITIGSKTGLEVQAYDKTTEIRQASGKDWMIELWQLGGYQIPSDGKPKNVWRVEARFGKGFLKERGAVTFEDVQRQLGGFMGEALILHRLASPSTDSNKARWPVHPLWQMAIDAAAEGPMAPLGRRFTMRRGELLNMLASQAAGVMRAVSVLEEDDFLEEDIDRLTAEVGKRLRERLKDRAAVKKLQTRYRNIDEAR